MAILRVERIRRISRADVLLGRRATLDVIEWHTPRTKCHSAIVGLTGEPIDLGLRQDLADLANQGTVLGLT